MRSIKTGGLEKEWALLQNQFDSYEKLSLLIKLVNVGLLAAAYFLNSMSVFVLFLLLIVWIQDAIWKTFQSRIETRLLELENYLLADGELGNCDKKAYQFNSQYQENRPGNLGLILEYLQQAIRPTVAFPHLLLLLILSIELLF